MDSPTSPVAERPAAAGVLPVVMAALVAPTDDPRQFRRYSLSQQVGIGMLPETEEPEDQDSEDQSRQAVFSSRLSVEARDLSLTGLYFVSQVPYRIGVQLEIQLALPHQIVLLPSVVRRLDTPARTELGALETAFGCGVSFLQSRTTPTARRALMKYLVARTG